jgi:hypothetical protein
VESIGDWLKDAGYDVATGVSPFLTIRAVSTAWSTLCTEHNSYRWRNLTGWRDPTNPLQIIALDGHTGRKHVLYLPRATYHPVGLAATVSEFKLDLDLDELGL